MKRNFLVKSLLVASILPFCSFIVDDNDGITPKETQTIVLTNDIDNGVDEETLQVPATATLTGNRLNVNFTGAIPLATVAVTNPAKGITTSTSIPTVTGVSLTIPVSLGTNIVTVTNEQSGESVSGEFEVEEEE